VAQENNPDRKVVLTGIGCCGNTGTSLAAVRAGTNIKIKT
jgi:hypothetical protein